MYSMENVTIVGGGPAGLLCAKELAYNDKKVIVFEEHEHIGRPVQCAGLVSKRGLDDLGVDYEDAVLNKCRGARVFSPSEKMMEIKRDKEQALVIDRAVFDDIIAEEALAEGARIVCGKRVKKKSGDMLVGADGADSLIAKTLGSRKKFIMTAQVTGKLMRDSDFVEIHFGGWSDSFFAWVIPVDEEHCRIGIGVETGNPQEALKTFMRDRGMDVKAEHHSGGLIPVFNDNPTVYPDKKTILVGDAADQVKASTGGGIAIGGFCARIAGEVIGTGLPIEDYELNWHKEARRELLMHKRIHEFLKTMSNEELDELFDLAIQEGVPEIIEKYGDMDKPSSLFKHLMGKPRVVAKMTKYFSKLPF